MSELRRSSGAVQALYDVPGLPVVLAGETSFQALHRSSRPAQGQVEVETTQKTRGWPMHELPEPLEAVLEVQEVPTEAKTKRRGKKAPSEPVEVHCPYCGALCDLVDDSRVYQKSYGGKVHACFPCGAHVGCHKRSPTFKPLGDPANKALRELRRRAHELFDALWTYAVEKQGRDRQEARSAAYKWLSERLGKAEGVKVHIGFMREEETQAVIDICEAIRRKDK